MWDLVSDISSVQTYLQKVLPIFDFVSSLPLSLSSSLCPTQEAKVREGAGCSALADLLGGFAHEQSGEGAAQCRQQTDPLPGE